MGYYDEHPFSYSRDYSEAGDRAGLALIGLAGLSSAISTFALLIYISWYSFFCNDETIPLVRGLRSFSRSALGAFLYSLLVSDFIQGSAFAMNLKWAADGGIQHSAACTAQGSVSQFGDLGGALWSLAIAYYTFSLLFLLQKPSIWLTCALLGVGWTFILVLPILGPVVIQNVEQKGHFYGISGAWCWIGDAYQTERFMYVYVSVALYFRRQARPDPLATNPDVDLPVALELRAHTSTTGLVYLRFSGRLFYDHGKLAWKRPANTRARISIHISGASGASSGSNGSRLVPSTAEFNGVGKHMKQVAKRLMFYPLVYSLVTVPVAICRISTFSGLTIPFPVYVFAGCAYSSSGLTNVILFIVTRHSFIQQVATMQTRIHVTQQVTVLEDQSRGTQTIHLADMSTSRLDPQEQVLIHKVEIGENGKGDLVVQLPPGLGVPDQDKKASLDACRLP
ncbi:hypothetical protein FRC07_007922 [Ceratobasidium sp. 392]|nr:hypothetical protein FRC07_007922 [Ceratobasidium sp. 392]